MSAEPKRPFILGIGGTATVGSSTEQALSIALASAEALGARTRMIAGEALLALPHYLSKDCMLAPAAADLVAQFRGADGLILASPGYHGSISGLVKNAIDYAEETSRDERVYFSGLPIGVIATAYGWQAAVSTLSTLRSIVHALRAYPTPFGAAVNTASAPFKNGACNDDALRGQLELVGRQVCDFATMPHR